jgi:hypothetical protein
VSNVLLPVIKLRKVANPFVTFPWDDGFLSRKEVTKAIKHHKLESRPYSEAFVNHNERVAYLVVYPASDPISVDVGVPSLGFIPNWIILDGNHRLAAAIYRNDKTIAAMVSGEDDYAFDLFGVKI